MKLLSNEGGRFVFYLSENEAETLDWAISQNADLRGPLVILSRGRGSMPEGAESDLRAAMKQVRQANADFLRRVLEPNGEYLKASAGEEGGFGLTLTREDLERVFQASNEIKLRHWEALGCPDEGTQSKIEPESDQWLNIAVMDLVNQIQMILLHALNEND